MEVAKKYTDENYVAINDLRSFGEDFVLQTQTYRNSFVEMIALNELDFVKIVETPTLVKKRYVKNVELKGMLDLEAKEHDYILELAKELVNGGKVAGIDLPTQKNIIKKYIDNGKDLTIVTNYLANNIDKLIVINESSEMELFFPQISNNDKKFISKSNNINLNYTIAQYQENTGCSYETGRKSLEKLTELKLFEKKKVGKKFVYKPTQKLTAIMKGGS